MDITTMLHAVDLAKFRLQWPTTKEQQQKYNRQYWAFYGGIMRRYIRLQQENARLSAAMTGMNGDFIATMERNRACNVDYENRIAAMCAERDALQAENAMLRDEVTFWKAEALKDGDDD